MDEALYIDLHFYILPRLCTFRHAIPTSLFIFNDFSVLLTYVHVPHHWVQNRDGQEDYLYTAVVVGETT